LRQWKSVQSRHPERSEGSPHLPLLVSSSGTTPTKKGSRKSGRLSHYKK
jgi:hypothetical protein